MQKDLFISYNSLFTGEETSNKQSADTFEKLNLFFILHLLFILLKFYTQKFQRKRTIFLVSE